MSSPIGDRKENIPPHKPESEGKISPAATEAAGIPIMSPDFKVPDALNIEVSFED